MEPRAERDANETHVTVATASHPGTSREHNEDAVGSHVEAPARTLVAVADGVSGEEGGEIASRTAIDVTLRAFADSPLSWGTAKRLYRAVQQANIEIHDRALVVTELRRMATTLTALVVDCGEAHAAHVGDSRLYLVRDGAIVQKTKDHTVAAERRRVGLISAQRAKDHPERSTLTRSLGRELIAAIDRITFPVVRGDVLIACSDGLYNVLDDEEIRSTIAGKQPADACDALIATANARGTADNLTVGVVEVTGEVPGSPPARGWRGALGRLLGS